MQGRRLGKPEVYSLEYIEDFFGPRTDADGHGSFAAVERSMSDRLLTRQIVFIASECPPPTS
jgi:hypothetical protein